MLLNKIHEAIERLNLNLQGKIVLTEAASGAYVVTPIIAALAGAEVYAFTKTTKYGSAEEIAELTRKLARRIGTHLNISITDTLGPDILSKTDIITNSGHLRPLNENMLQHLKQGAVVSLMYEAWERRDEDIDIDFCRKNNITVAATNERHPDVDVFNYLGDMTLKMIFEAGSCLYNNTFILMCNNDFGPYIAKVLSKLCRSLGVCDLDSNREKYEGMTIDWLGNFPDLEITEKYKTCDAIVFTASPFGKAWIGDTTEPIRISELLKSIPSPLVLRFAGDINEKACDGKIRYFPKSLASGHMGILPSALGYEPIIRLQSGGLKAAELALKNTTNYNHQPLVEFI